MGCKQITEAICLLGVNLPGVSKYAQFCALFRPVSHKTLVNNRSKLSGGCNQIVSFDGAEGFRRLLLTP